MKKLINILFSSRKNDSYQVAIDRLEEIKSKLELQPKSIKFKEIYITEINF